MDENDRTHKRSAYISQHDVGSSVNQESLDETANIISIEQLRSLVRLIDRSDVSEVELKRTGDGTRLVLRKAKAPESNGQQEGVVLRQLVDSASASQQVATSAPAVETKHYISAHLVGIFHAWAKPRGGPLVAVGDHVKLGQPVATIESLNIINEVESSVDGRVVEILVQEGQPVEYGQHLMVVDTADTTEGA